jgi:GH24 family phage-related lysozyme (muramidase)
MADESSLKELDDWMARQTEMYNAGYISAKQLHEAQKDYAAGLKGYTANLKQSISQLGTSSKDMAATMLKGQDATAAMSKTVEGGAAAVAAYTAKFGPAGKIIGEMTKALAALNTAALKQSNKLFDSYKQLSQVGLVGGQAMNEVYEKMRQFGYTDEQLSQLNTVLSTNSKTLGKFYGSALEGSRVMGRAAAGFVENREQFRNMGFTVDDMNEGLAGYIAQEGALGRLRGKTDKELTNGTIEYLKELDAITKMTGMSRKEQEDAREQAMQIETFYAGLQDLDVKAREQAFQAYNLALAKGGPKMAAEFAANFNGAITGATDVLVATGGESMKYFSKDFFANGGTAAEAIKGVADNISPEMLEITKGLNQVGVSFGPSLRTLKEFKQGVETITVDTKTVITEQQNQIAGLDSATKSQAKIAENMLKTAQASDDFVRMAVPAATKFAKWTTDLVEWTTRALPGASSGGIFGAGARQPGSGAAPAGGSSGAAPPGPQSSAPSGTVPTTASASILNYIKATERFTPTAFWDYKQWTNGYGTKAKYPTGGPNDPGPRETVSLSEAESRFSTYVNASAQTVGNFGQSKKYQWGQNQVDALTSFIFNGGSGWLGQVTDNGKRKNPEIATSIPLYNKAGGQELAGLTRRRQEEAAWFRNNMVSAEKGGAFSGPKSGYPATLHGTEAVIPLNNNNGNFVEMFEKMAKTNKRMVSLLHDHVEVQSRIKSATKNTADSSGKMLHYAQG